MANTIPQVDLSTRELRVKYAAHQYTDAYPVAAWQRCERLGITSEEFIDGIALKSKQEDERRVWVGMYGNPEFGDWAVDKRDGRRKPRALIEEETNGISTKP